MRPRSREAFTAHSIKKKEEYNNNNNNNNNIYNIVFSQFLNFPASRHYLRFWLNNILSSCVIYRIMQFGVLFGVYSVFIRFVFVFCNLHFTKKDLLSSNEKLNILVVT